MKFRPSAGGLVYSTDSGRMCPVCRKPIVRCVCKRVPVTSPPSDGIVRVSRESKGRGGKLVTIVRGVALAPNDLDALGKQLKAACGSGGTVKEGVVEVQGDHCDKVIALLTARGYKVKRAGG
jgi:translation initiation factor 1